MANSALFSSNPRPTAQNEAGGKAFALTDKQALAQLAATNCFNGVFYADEDALLATTQKHVGALVAAGEFEFLGKVAVYARHRGYMKDMPAFLVAALASHGAKSFPGAFAKVIDNGRMLRTFVQIGRSGAAGRKLNFSARRIRRVIQDWFANRTDSALFRDSVGNDPSIADVIKMARPTPRDSTQSALFRYLMGKEHAAESLPEVVRQYERFKVDRDGEVPDVEFRLLDSLGLNTAEWDAIARRAPWHMTRMNLNTFQRHGVFDNAETVQIVANRLRDAEQIRKVKVFPYQLMAAYRAASGVPMPIQSALQDAMEIATLNTPKIEGRVCVAVDISGSMSCAVTGNRGSATSAVSCREVASLFASCILRNNDDARIMPFSDHANYDVRLNPRDTVITNAQQLAQLPSGGTNCSAVLERLNREDDRFDLVVYASDNQSWIGLGGGQSREWQKFRQRNPNARLACIDLAPYSTVQAPVSKSVLHVGGFSDSVFDVVASFAKGGDNADFWIAEIEQVVV